MNTKMMITLDDLVVEFASNYSLGMKAVKAAAETYATALKKFPRTAEARFRERFREIRTETWRIFEEIGNGKLPPQAILMNPGAVEHLRMAKIPLTKCERMDNARVSVINPATGKPNDVPFTHLTESQAVQVFDPKTHQIRTEAEQKKFLTQAVRVNHNTQPTRVADWVIKGDRLVVNRSCEIKLSDLLKIVEQIKTEK